MVDKHANSPIKLRIMTSSAADASPKVYTHRSITVDNKEGKAAHRGIEHIVVGNDSPILVGQTNLQAFRSGCNVVIIAAGA